MFTEKTVFILGAGASYPYGYPLGRELINNIIKYIEEDEIYLPEDNIGGAYSMVTDVSSISQRKQLNRENGDYKFLLQPEFAENLVSLGINKKSPNPFAAQPIGYKKSQLLHLNINNKQFKVLADKLREFDPVSIDNFLHDHEDLKDIGKIMICYSLLRAENREFFNKDSQIGETCSNNWYRLLLNNITVGCGKKPQAINQNKLDIITYNYDMSLEYFITSRLSTMPTFNADENKYGEKFAETLNFDVNHIYGQLYKPNALEDYASYGEQAKTNDKCALNLARILRSFYLRENIRLIQDREDNDEIAIKKIKEAKDIYIIGFGFDKENIRRLDFKKSLINLSPELRQKNIFLFNYAGEMQHLLVNFQKLTKKEYNHNPKNETLSFYQSTKKNIEHALGCDFNIFC